jgi:hypothetical protein
MDATQKKEPTRLVIETDPARREKLRIIATLRGTTMRELIEDFIDSLPDPPTMS